MQKTLGLSTAIFLFLLTACSNKDKDPCARGIPCALYNPRSFRFTIKDKSSGQDLFFSTSPAYPFSALTINTAAGKASWQIDTIDSHRDFVISGESEGINTLYFNIADTKTDTLVYNARSYRVNCCEDSTILSNIIFNTQPLPGPLNLSTAGNSTVLVFYK